MHSPLIDMCPRLDRHLRPLPIVCAPTPVARLDAASAAVGGASLWVKRDGLTNPEYGGNKLRKLAFLLAHAIDRDHGCIVTAGTVGSSHLVATSFFARKVGVRVAAAVCPQPGSRAVRANLGSHAVLGTELHPVASRAEIAAALARIFAVKTLFGENPTLVLPGGSSPIGTLGCVDAGIEFARQVAEGTCPEPAAVVVPVGSGGTAAGLALGFAIEGLASEVVAVRTVERRWLPAVLPRAIVLATAALLARFGLPGALRAAARIRLRIEDRYLGDGYGHPTRAGDEATDLFRESESISLAPTYTAKAAAAFLDLARDPGLRDRPLVLWLTASETPPPGIDAPRSTHLALPPEFHGFFPG